MKRNTRNFLKYAGLFSIISGGLLITSPAISPRAVAQQPVSQINPCPRIYYEEPHNNRVLVPQGCPPNALTRRLEAQGQLPAPIVPTTPAPAQIPLGVGGEAPDSRTLVMNPCPRIYYEEPFNSRNVVPQGCPPNARTQQLISQGIPPSQAVSAPPPVNVIQPPLPEQQQPPSAKIALANGRVDIRLVNDTGAEVTYQVVGDTPARSLEGKSNTMLRDLNAPVTMTFFREDGGLLQVTPQPSEKTGMMVVKLNETTNLEEDTKTVQIQEDGKVFLN
ncbi:hypothetical protein [Umezakia ovalisporum]|jgi:hypothetical protein|uniref:Uncharacterized protein n=2 Tax=Umezakia ovalisporum TaxID=75695 RepID=A0AA43GZ17_9CYAN|nr:hypothetical protein [Umezakia ovalisporum]MBI1240034.1 hypothetical protein [Nostoc sp. RI_552]MDH6056945.1 hypothetical protein [Umezakia ovalisporum FSS-43]MDH6064489.1 hypothetical protein [Umezakia ovalisporum FSS-62]MDH6068395.1 hypothetical protein [Umezakia ovalisporum APH033B]MDH6071136.1 hypothetical protein [Umezakia ovalisporum CobakiLakeA]